MDENNKEPTAEEPILVNIIKDSKQMRVTIPAYIVENFRIDPTRQEFAWFVQEFGENNQGNKIVRVVGTFVSKNKSDKNENK